ncbi:MAG: hypothetical protein HY825_14575 [Acidobacteria bacterium]|nr:hypothetical protein [Acidobacteriota bacterium]
MEKQTQQRKRRARSPVDAPDDDTLLETGREVLVGKLGVTGTLRFLRLVGGARDRWEDLRRGWASLSMDELQVELDRAGLSG